MKIIMPLDVTDAMLTASNILEDDAPLWNDTTAYTRGQKIISTTTHRIYRALRDHAGVDPDLEALAFDDPLVDDPTPRAWQILSSTNKWQPFDQKPSVVAQNPEVIVYEIAPGDFVAGLALFNVSAQEIHITGTTPDAQQVYSATTNMTNMEAIADWYDYFFAELTFNDTAQFSDLPPVSNAIWRIEIVNPGGVAGVGQIAIGPIFAPGQTIIPSSFSMLDFSAVQTDDFGNLTRVVRPSTETFDFDIHIKSAAIFNIKTQLEALRGGRPAVWIGAENPELGASVYGILTNADVSYAAGPVAQLSITIQGLV